MIGQRYHVVVTMNDTTQPSQNYWIRTTPADGCNGFDDDNPVDERTGILRYAESEEKPTTTAHKFANDCSDEPYESLIPIIPWEVGNPANPRTSAPTPSDPHSPYTLIRDPHYRSIRLLRGRPHAVRRYGAAARQRLALGPRHESAVAQL